MCLTCHLKTVDLVEFKGHENELELVRFLLKNGHVLQKLRISWLEDVYNRREIISRIMKFPRSSSSVILKFLQPKSSFDFCEILRWLTYDGNMIYVRVTLFVIYIWFAWSEHSFGFVESGNRASYKDSNVFCFKITSNYAAFQFSVVQFWKGLWIMILIFISNCCRFAL